MLRIGIDVGGTNTDAALLRGMEVLATAKSLTTADIFSGISASIRLVAAEASINLGEVEAVMVGTTHFLNAVLTRTGLTPCSLLRLCGTATKAMPPFLDLPEDIVQAICWHSAMLPGGLHFDGVTISEVDVDLTRQATRDAVAAGVGAIVVSAVYSPMDTGHEDAACEAVLNELRALGRADVLITKSSDVSGMGLLCRENASVLNAALRPLARRIVAGVEKAVCEVGCIKATTFLTQNDGTVIAAREASRLPIRCVQCGPVNSLRGAAILAGISDAIVVDVGGTSTDIVALVKGFPRPASCDAYIGEVRTNFPVPDVHAIGLGGGSCAHASDVGPDSVARELPTKSLAFGGQTCTATDIAIRLGFGPPGLGDAAKVQSSLPEERARMLWQAIQAKVAQAIDRCKTVAGDVTVILVGGGSFLVENVLPGVSEIIRPRHGQSANAVGAAAASVAGSVDVVAQLGGGDRVALLEGLKKQALERAEAAGAEVGTAEVLEVEEVALAYLPGGACRVRIRAVGKLSSARKITAAVEAEPDDTPPLLDAHPRTKPTEVRLGWELGSSVVGDQWPGAWHLTEADVEAISVGVGVLGCGGGGSPHSTKLAVLAAMRRLGPPVVVQIESLPDDAIVYSVGFMGAPTVGVEMLQASEAETALRSLQDMQPAGTKDKKKALMTVEIGGANGMQQLLMSIVCGLPAIDADLMGRAFPRLEMVTTAIMGLGILPAVVADHRGNVIVCPQASGIRWVEDMLRPVCAAMGCTCGISMRPMSGAEAKSVTVKRTVTEALKIGQAILDARARKTPPVEACVKAAGGWTIFEGKIVDCERSTTAGFAKGKFTIAPIGRSGSEMVILFQNENLEAKLGDRLVAVVPDLIVLLETSTGRPLQTEDVRYGLLVSVVVLPAPEILTSPEALKFVGPKAFGLEVDYLRYRPQT